MATKRTLQRQSLCPGRNVRPRLEDHFFAEEKSKIEQNMISQRENILASLNPMQLYGFLDELDISEISTDASTNRRQKAEILLQKVKEKEAHCRFLSALENDVEHRGHQYIVSLLRETAFADEDQIRDSKLLYEQIKKNLKEVIENVDVPAIETSLIEFNLVTADEIEKLRNQQTTRRYKATQLLEILRTKGPTAHSVFVRDCLRIDDVHGEIYKLLTKDITWPQNTKVTKRNPSLLLSPNGLTSKRYIQKMSTIRESHLKGGNCWDDTEEMLTKEINSSENCLELKIALILESCNPYVIRKQSEEVIKRVDRARKMCIKLYEQDCNARVLEGRCEWVLARLYSYKKELHKSSSHINSAFCLISDCVPGEEKMLICFVNAYNLLTGDHTILARLKKAETQLKLVITLAEYEDYGTNIALYCKLFLARILIGYYDNDGADGEKLILTEAIEEANKLLKDTEKHNMPYRTKAAFLRTQSLIFKREGLEDQALNCSMEARAIAEKHEPAI